MGRSPASPALRLDITQENWVKAREASSGGCLIADSIKQQYPNLTSIRVDMATIRATDRKKGLRYTWLTPSAGQELLLAYDQGWEQPVDRVNTSAAAVVSVVKASSAARITERQAELDELNQKVTDGGVLTKEEKAQKARLEVAVSRPAKHTAAKVGSRGTVHARPPKQGAANPNLLRGRDRLFGAKTAKPAKVFEEAVEQAVQARLAELAATK